MSTVASTPAASACAACARPISPPSAVTAALRDMFCALNGATRWPARANRRQSAATSRLLPTPDPVPCTMRQAADITPSRARPTGTPARPRARPWSCARGVARAEIVPDRRHVPPRLANALEVVVEPRIGKVHGDHLLAAAVPESQAPSAGDARAAVGAEE